ncbi:MAG: class I SAM-dependent methyltransferase [Spirochaetes bacterium]|nr:class I SAM-dependent methyltransferase [Spirochaetota bacterium]
MNSGNPARRKVLFVWGQGPGYGNGHRVRTEKIAHSSEGRLDFRLHPWRGAQLLHEEVDAFRPDLVWLDKRESPPKLVRDLQARGARVLVMDSVGKERNVADYVAEGIPGLEDHPGRANLVGVEWLPDSRLAPHPEADGRGTVMYAGGLEAAQVHPWCLEAAGLIRDGDFPGKIKERLILWLPKGDAWLESGREHSEIHSLGFKEVAVREVSGNAESDFKRELGQAGLLVGYFGLSALEALSCGIPVLLHSPSSIHERLTQKHLAVFSSKAEKIGGGTISWTARRQAAVECRQKFPIGKRFDLWPRVLESLCDAVRPPHCPSCASKRISIAHRRRQANLWICGRCGLGWLQETVAIGIFGEEAPEHARGEYGAAYFLDEYVRAYGKTYEEDRESIYRLSDARLDFLGRFARGGRLLDVGAAMGFFLDRAKRRGFETHGVELSQYAVDRASKTHGIRCENILESPVDQTFEVVTLWYVVEHFREVRRLLETLAARTAAGGILALGTPNIDGLSARFDRGAFLASSPDDHYFLYGKRSLVNLLAPFGFRLVGVRATGIHPSRFRRLFPLLSRILPQGLFEAVARWRNLGDTAEFYFKKTG